MRGYRAQGLIDRRRNLTAQGYRLETTTQGYQVWAPSGEYLGGAGSLPRDKPKHWRHARADAEMHLQTACELAERHRAKVAP